MGRLRNLAQTFRDFVTNHVEEPYIPLVAISDDGYDKSTKIALFLLKEEIDKPLRKLEDYLNEMPRIFDVFGLEKSPDYTLFSKWDGEFPMRSCAACSADLAVKGDLQLEPLIIDRKPLTQLNEAMHDLETGTGIRQIREP